MAFDPIRRLAEAGTAIEQLSDRQLVALSSLSEAEVEVLASIKARLDAAGGDVEGQDANVFITG